MKTLPFNLAKALAGHPVITRDGRKVEFIVHDPKYPGEQKLLVRLVDYTLIRRYNDDGTLLQNCSPQHAADLFLLDDSPPKLRPWKLEEAPFGDWFKLIGVEKYSAQKITMVRTCGEVLVHLDGMWRHNTNLSEHYTHSISPLGPWLPCGVIE